MSKSDILNNFFKIAQEKGLFSEEPTTKKTKQKLEKIGRAHV